MSTLIFHSLDAYINENYGRPSTEETLLQAARPSQPPERESSITIHITPDPDTKVELTTGEDFRGMRGSLMLKPSDELRPIASEDKSRNLIGYIQYSEEYRDGAFHLKPSYFLSALIPRAQFEHLSTILRQSRMPLSMIVDIEGLKVLDEFGVQWDTKARVQLPMTSIKFSIRAAHFPPIDWDDEQEVGALMPATRADLRAAMQGALTLTQTVNARLNWLLAGLVLLGAVFLSGRFGL